MEPFRYTPKTKHMSEKEQKDEELESGADEAAPEAEAEQDAGNPAEAETPEPAPKETQSILYGTRKRRPGAPTSPSAKTLDQIRGPYEDDDIVEMDDLVVRSTAPEELIGGDQSDGPSRRRDRSDRGERRGRREDRRREPREASQSDEASEPAADSELEAYPSAEPAETATSTEEDRPKRIASADNSKRVAQRPVEEFSPSKDGKRAEPRKRPEPEASYTPPKSEAKKTGFFGWPKSLFSSEPEPPKKPARKRSQNRRRRRRGGPNRGPDGEFKGERPNGNRRRRSNRNRRPRGEGGHEDGGQRRRRRRRPRGERNQAPSE